MMEFRIDLHGEDHTVEGELHYRFVRKSGGTFHLECRVGPLSTSHRILSAFLAFVPECFEFEVPQPAAKLTELFIGPACELPVR